MDDDNSNLLVAQLLYLDSMNHKDITMYINSPGGSVTAGTQCMASCSAWPAAILYSITVPPSCSVSTCNAPACKSMHWMLCLQQVSNASMHLEGQHAK